MLSDYIRAAMGIAVYNRLDNGTWYAEIPGVQGVWANGETQLDAQRELQEVLEGWIVLRLERQHPIPEIQGHSLHVAQIA